MINQDKPMYGILCRYNKEYAEKYSCSMSNPYILMECEGDALFDLDKTKKAAARFLGAYWCECVQIVELKPIGEAND